MSTTGGLYSSTLQTVTSTKLQELSKKRFEFERRRETLILKINAEPDPLKKLEILNVGTRECFNVNLQSSRHGPTDSRTTINPDIDLDLSNTARFLEQAQYDSSLAGKVVVEWTDRLTRHLDVQSLRFQYADLYAKLVSEWLASDRSDVEDVDMSDSFEQVPGLKKLESRAAWEKAVFEPAMIDPQALHNYLLDLFQNNADDDRGAARAYQWLRHQVQNFERSMTGAGLFNNETLEWVIGGLVASDLLSNDKRSVLRDFARNPAILIEIADVLNMRMSSLDAWSWGDQVAVEQRRQLRGSYSIYMHEDLLQAIFLHFIGVKWSVFFKATLGSFRAKKEVWKSHTVDLSEVDKTRHRHFLNQAPQIGGLNAARQDTWAKEYFMFQLLDNERQRFEVGEGEEEAEAPHPVDTRDSEDDGTADDMTRRKRRAPDQLSQMGLQSAAVHQQQLLQAHQRQQMQQMQVAQTASSATTWQHDRINNAHAPPVLARYPIKAKQKLLHLLSTEIVINTSLHGELTCVRSVFDQWNSSMPHDTIQTVLDFLGVSKKWLGFFQKYLTAPLRFIDEDVEPRIRRRGMPGAHSISDFLGEVVLFCLDYAVNKATDGGLLYRLGDDFWFWSSSEAEVVKAWQAVSGFTQVTGTSLNQAKTGSVRVVDDHGQQNHKLDSRLPTGRIRWGFLVMDDHSGSFVIDKSMVDDHIEKLKTQLQNKSRSIFDWISAYNAYAATFFSSNFGQAANCFGRAHVNQMLAAHRHVQQSIADQGNAVDYLKAEIHRRFGVTDIPDGFLFFPVELGGLDLRSPFVPLMQIRASVRSDPHTLMTQYHDAEKAEYGRRKNHFEKHGGAAQAFDIHTVRKIDGRPEVFISFGDYVRHREDIPTVGGDKSLVSIYTSLLSKPVEASIDATAQVVAALARLQGRSTGSSITSSWDTMEPYWKWITQMYGPEIISKFDGPSIVDAKLLPIGMVSILRERRIKWQD